MIHILPLDDSLRHSPSVACRCWPDVQFFDPEDGRHWEGGPIVKHVAQDGRDLFEKHGFASGKKWATLRSGN